MNNIVGFEHIHNHSTYSLLDGVSFPHEMAERMLPRPGRFRSGGPADISRASQGFGGGNMHIPGVGRLERNLERETVKGVVDAWRQRDVKHHQSVIFHPHLSRHLKTTDRSV